MLTKTQLVITGAGLFIVIVFGLMFAGVIPGLKKDDGPAWEGKLVVWGFDDRKWLEDTLGAFSTKNPGVRIEYKQFRNEAEYEAALLDTLAAGSGPDVFAVRNTGLLKHLNKIVPLAPEKLTPLQLRQFFPQVVERDFTVEGKIYALPFAIDTLSMIYNRDIFNQESVITPPATWDDFIALVPKITRVDQSRRIERAAAAIGGSTKNIRRAADLLSLLMLQNGVPMVTADATSPKFSTHEGAEALTFYTQFTNTGSNVYTWNNGLPNALDLFIQGKVAIIFDYAPTLATIRERNPLMNIDTAPVPQRKGTTQPVTYASYGGYAVARQSLNPDLSWEFILSSATDKNLMSGYALKSGTIPALTALLNTYLEDPQLNVFARQTLVARAWQQVDALAVTNIFSDMIALVIENRASVDTALRQAESEIAQIMSRRAAY